MAKRRRHRLSGRDPRTWLDQVDDLPGRAETASAGIPKHSHWSGKNPRAVLGRAKGSCWQKHLILLEVGFASEAPSKNHHSITVRPKISNQKRKQRKNRTKQAVSKKMMADLGRPMKTIGNAQQHGVSTVYLDWWQPQWQQSYISVNQDGGLVIQKLGKDS